MTTEKETAETETAKIKEFENEFGILCDKFGIKAMCIGTRSETDHLDEKKDTRMCAAFSMLHAEKVTANEGISILKAHEKSSELVEKMLRDVVFSILSKECECEKCTEKRKQGETVFKEEFQGFHEDEREIKFSQDGDQVCATFDDFINYQESIAGFGKTQEEAKKDLLMKDKKGKWEFNPKFGYGIDPAKRDCPPAAEV